MRDTHKKKYRILVDSIILLVLTIITFIIATKLDLFEWFVELTRNYEQYELDEFFTLFSLTFIFLFIFVVRRMQDLFSSNQNIQIISDTDTLTGILSRRKIIDLIDMELARIRRYQGRSSLLIIDLDNFKVVNDTWTHKAGDDVLIKVTREIQTHLRDTDHFGRLGGDEFVILLPNTNIVDGRNIAERIRICTNELVMKWNKDIIPISLSLGVTEIEGSETSSVEIMHSADLLLYKAKRLGKNKVQ